MKTYHRTLTIAGSDSGGGAGIQADLKTFSALGCFGMSVITALTAQNTREVTGIFPVPPEFIGQQIDAVLSDIGTDAVKIGMLHSPEVITVVARHLKKWAVPNLVLDPVMVAKSGDKLLQDDAVTALKQTLIPLADIITPNLPEASVLLGRPVISRADMDTAIRDLADLGSPMSCSKADTWKIPAATICCFQPPRGGCVSCLENGCQPPIPTGQDVLCLQPSAPAWPGAWIWKTL